MTKQKTVTVIIPTYNRMQYLDRALSSVYEQTRVPDQIIVVDDGSTDTTCAHIKSNHPHLTYLHQDNQGVSAARNCGIAKADSDYIAFLDSDDVWLPQKLEYQLQQMDQETQCMLGHTEEIWIRNGVRVNAMNKHKKRGGRIYNRCLPLCVISPSSVIIRQELFERIGGFDESLPACEDYDLWLRACSQFDVAFLSEPQIIKYGGHDDQLSRKYWGMDRYRIIALQKILQSNTLGGEDYDKTLAMLRKKCDIYIQGALKRHKQEEVAHYTQIRDSFA